MEVSKGSDPFFNRLLADEPSRRTTETHQVDAPSLIGVIMMFRMHLQTAVLLLAVWVGGYSTARAGVVFTIELAGVQATSVPGAITETFDSGTWSSLVGDYSGNAFVFSPSLFSGVYGGAFGSYYLGIFDGIALLELNTPQKYFGMWWAAADADDVLTLFDGPSILGTYTAASFVPFLGAAYFGNPNNGFNPSEAYVYVNFTTTGNSNITHVLFRNESNMTVFETDNHSILDQPISPPGIALIPEPGLGLLAGMGLVSGLVRRRRVTRV